jgi:hypothetical protein
MPSSASLLLQVTANLVELGDHGKRCRGELEEDANYGAWGSKR